MKLDLKVMTPPLRYIIDIRFVQAEYRFVSNDNSCFVQLKGIQKNSAKERMGVESNGYDFNSHQTPNSTWIQNCRLS